MPNNNNKKYWGTNEDYMKCLEEKKLYNFSEGHRS